MSLQVRDARSVTSAVKSNNTKFSVAYATKPTGALCAYRLKGAAG